MSVSGPFQAVFGQPVVAVLLGVAVVGFAALLVFGLVELRLAWRILRDEPDSVLDAPDGGPIELAGVADVHERTLRSPFTDTECLCYEYAVEEERHSKHGRSWTTIAHGRETVPFRLKDDTGSVLIEPPGADLRLGRERRLTVDGGERPPESIVRFIEADDRVDSQQRSIDLGPIELTTGKDRRFVERRLDVGETVHALGVARFDTTAARTSGQVNAAVGIDPDALESGRVRWWLHRLVGPPFVISDATERGTAKRVAAVGGLATVGAAVGFGVLAIVVL